MLTLAALLALSAFAQAPAMAAPTPAVKSAIDPHAPAAGMAPRPRNRGISVPIPEATASLAPPHIYGPHDLTRPLIVIDPGHGGHDPGARNEHLDLQEKDVTLAIAKAVRDALIKSGRVRVALTREDDRFLALEERFGVAREMGAALFLSIHADASEEAGARGATVYTLSEVASDQEAGRLAARENRADILNGVDLSGQSSAVSSILIDLMQRETMSDSAHFADLLHREESPLLSFRAPWHRRAALVVLRSPDTPSVLFETGYITNDADADRLMSKEGQRQIALGVARAVAVYVATHGAK